MRTHGAFVSAIGPVIVRYVVLKRALGRQFDTQQHILTQLDRFLASSHASDLTAESFAAWCSSIQHVTAGARRQRMRAVYHLCLFRQRSEPTCFVPEPSQFPPPQPRPRPHIFSEAEIVQLLHATEVLQPNAPSPLHRQVARLAIVLLYTTGLRRREIVRLTLGDWDATDRVLLVRESKFHKSRLAPLSADAVIEMERYLEDRRRPGFPCDAGAPLLLTRHGALTAYSGGGFGLLMHRLFRQADVRTAAGRPPRVHALLRWYRAGVDVQTRLPALTAYMGHGSIVSTQYYLTFFDAVAQAASERFDQHCSRLLSTRASADGDR